MARIPLTTTRSRYVPVGVLDWSQRETFPAYLVSLRKKTGCSLRAAASEMGISYSYLAKLENGDKETPPSLKVLGYIARFYNRELSEVMREAGFNVLPAEEAPKGRAPLQLRTLEEHFERLITHPALKPGRWAPSEQDLIPPLVKRQWTDFARKLEKAIREDDLSVAEVLSGEDTGESE